MFSFCISSLADPSQQSQSQERMWEDPRGWTLRASTILSGIPPYEDILLRKMMTHPCPSRIPPSVPHTVWGVIWSGPSVKGGGSEPSPWWCHQELIRPCPAPLSLWSLWLWQVGLGQRACPWGFCPEALAQPASDLFLILGNCEVHRGKMLWHSF